MPDDLVIVSTTSGQEAARRLATAIVEERLGACVQIVGPIESVYSWDNETQVESEWRVEVKTNTTRAADLVAYIQAHHDYDLPEVNHHAVLGGSEAYLDWANDRIR